MAALASDVIEDVTFDCQLVEKRVALIVSSLGSCRLNRCIRSWRGVGCLLTNLLDALSTAVGIIGAGYRAYPAETFCSA